MNLNIIQVLQMIIMYMFSLVFFLAALLCWCVHFYFASNQSDLLCESASNFSHSILDFFIYLFLCNICFYDTHFVSSKILPQICMYIRRTLCVRFHMYVCAYTHTCIKRLFYSVRYAKYHYTQNCAHEFPQINTRTFTALFHYIEISFSRGITN